MKSAKLPTLYIPHGGGPCFFMDWGPTDPWLKLARWLRALGNLSDVAPAAVLVISGHWEEPEFVITGNPSPPLIYDYYGFPEHTYQIKYDAPGSPPLAQTVRKLLENNRIPARIDPSRGFDHGVFIPFKLIYPNASIPIVQMSLKQGLDPAAHLQVGAALEPLRDEGVLIVGSGMSYHNLSEFGRGLNPFSDQFDAWLTAAACAPDRAMRQHQLQEWYRAPAARNAHPRPEHLLPLMVAAGAAGDDLGEKVFTDRILGTVISAFQFGKANSKLTSTEKSYAHQL